MKIFTLEYTGAAFQDWANLGDDIQMVAARRLLPRVDSAISRDSLAEACEPGVISMNGFFGRISSWPPSPVLEPFFFSFHIAANAKTTLCSPESIQYLKKHEPIGCRDRGTMAILQRQGVDAFYSKCISLTFDKRAIEPENGTVFIVGLSKAAGSVVPRSILKGAVIVEQPKLRLPSLSGEIRERLAEHLLDTYAKRASLVITSKIHCAMPCIAMGIPVVFLYDRGNKGDYRVEIINDLVGINSVRGSWLFRKLLNRFLGKKINWSPDPVDLEEEKLTIKAGYLKAFQAAVDRFSKRN
jgi:hypothetical protein